MLSYNILFWRDDGYGSSLLIDDGPLERQVGLRGAHSHPPEGCRGIRGRGAGTCRGLRQGGRGTLVKLNRNIAPFFKHSLFTIEITLRLNAPIRPIYKCMVACLYYASLQA